MGAKSKSNEIQITRVYDAPAKVVWEAWTDPAQVAQWWGPRGFSLTTHSKDLRPGGIWHYTMHGPDGTDYPNKTLYFEVEEAKKLVYDHGGNDERDPLFRVTVLFSEQQGKTKMEMTMSLSSPEQAEETRKFIKKAGGDSTWDRLAEYLEKKSTGAEKFVINRSFHASIETLFEMWTKPEHVSRWMPPIGFTMKFLESDIRVGSSTFYSMTGDKGLTMYGSIEYLQIEKPIRLVYVQQFRDEKGNISRHPLLPVWPESMLTTVTFTAENAEKTRVTVVWEPNGSFTRDELENFIDHRRSMTQGWTGSFDKLEALLSS